MKATPQEAKWAGPKGVKYAETYFYTLEQLDRKWQKAVSGVPRSQMNRAFLRRVPKDSSILEVGCNVGNQLAMLRDQGYDDLSGIELCKAAVRSVRKNRPWIKVKRGNACRLPYADDSFDLVMTTWVLTHINPRKLHTAVREIIRVSKRFIWGCEPHRSGMKPKESVPKRQYLWRANFKKLFMTLCPELKLVKSKLYHCRQRSEMYLLEKRK